MGTERKTKQEMVKDALFEGVERTDLPSRTGLSKRQVARAILHLRQLKQIPDEVGEYVPWVRTPDQKEELRRRFSNIPRPEVAVNQVGDLWKTIRLLALRNATAFEIEELTGKDKGQIAVDLNRKRTVMTIPDYRLPENRRERKRRAWKKGMDTKNGIEYSDDQKKTIEMARKLVDAGKVTEDLSLWNLTLSVGKSMKKDWSESFAMLILIECFFKARLMEIKGETQEMEKYFELGREVDPEWFNNAAMNKDRKSVNKAISFLATRASHGR